jgi:hypothetical protein
VKAAGVVAGLILGSLLPLVAAGAQNLARADSLVLMGRVGEAEPIYFAAARAQPRNPRARLALGRYLAARGATKVGAVLIEEARDFGLAPEIAATYLAPLYARLDDHTALLRLPASPQSATERARTRWLSTNVSRLSGMDSVNLATRPGDGSSLFSFPAIVSGDTVWIAVEPGMLELTLDRSRATAATAEHFGDESPQSQRASVLREIRIGGLRMTNVPVSFDRAGGSREGRVGLDFLRRFAPTYDPEARTLILRRGGRIAARSGGERVVALDEAQAIFVVLAGRLQPLFAESASRTLRERRWTWDPRRGEFRLE